MKAGLERVSSSLAAAPFAGMVGMEGCAIALTIMAKTVLSGGMVNRMVMSPYVFVVYVNALGTLFLFPFSFLYHRSWWLGSGGGKNNEILEEKQQLQQQQQQQPVFPLLVRYFFMGFTGIALSQNLAFMGLVYSSPIVVCAMGLLIPAFSSVLDVLLGGRAIKSTDWSTSTFKFKLIGTLISAVGAITVVTYKGPYIREARPSPSPHLQQKQHRFVFYSLADADSWAAGCLLLAASSLCVSIWNFLQSDTVKRNPKVMEVASCYNLAGTVQCAMFAWIVERDLGAWKIKLVGLESMVILVTAVFGSIIRSSVHIWSARAKGSLYVAMFQPFRIVWATFFGVSFFVNGLHYGSVIGTVVCGMGYYTILWGRIKEDEGRKVYADDVKCSSDNRAPLLVKDNSQV
ncbi:unnamed protein product [Linum tenue]|uniref:WAT1-related protein n=1 Tax=Linum tenue TaxID=586396 RepID=A0AAV0H302_9ROSI|nr:unnamed protein product [Linum tenue]